MSTHDLLRELENRWRFCHACHLRSGCRQVVFGEENPSAALMFVGQAPGAEEDRQGRPFVGPAFFPPVTASLARDKMEILSVLDRAAPG